MDSADLALAMAEARAGRSSEAIRLFAKILEIDPDNFEATFWSSVLYRQAGKNLESIRFAEQAKRLNPHEAHVLSNLGLGYLAVHELSKAVECFRHAAQLNPKVPQTFHHLGVALQLQGQDDAAIEAFRRALDLAPASADTLTFLAQSLMNRLDTSEATECAEKLLALRPKSAAAHLLLANALISENRIEEAERRLRTAIALDPKDGTALAMMGTRLQGLGRLEDANASFRKSIELQPVQGFAYCALIRNHRVTSEDSSMIGEMERLAAEAAMPARGLSFLHFGLGKAYEDVGRYEAAMQHFDEANRISYKLRFGEAKFDKEQYAATIDRTIQIFSKDLLAEYRSSRHESEKPIFIVGMMRSGTTLVEQILSSHPEVAAGGEQQFWMRRAKEAMPHPSLRPDLARVRMLARQYLEEVERRFPGSEHVTDKMPDNYLVLGFIHLAFPNARIIHTRRNPIDTCISIYTTPNRTSDPYANDRGNIVFAYEQYLKLMKHWRTVIPQNRMIEVNYEELVAEPELYSREWVAFCGLDWNDACLHPERNPRAVATPSVWQVRQPVYKTSIERWRRYETWLGPFERLNHQ